jgi:hypothetical protein
MRLRHNKKRNTAFLYELLVKQYAIASLQENKKLCSEIKETLSSFFRVGKPLANELALYKNLYETNSIDGFTAMRLVQESYNAYQKLDQKTIFNEQTKLINWINKNVGQDAFDTFVPNYKTLATISQIFGGETDVKQKVILERKIVGTLLERPQQQKQSELQPIDNLVYRTVVQNFNKKYNETLNESQRRLIESYVMSITDGGLQFQMRLNEEIQRIRETITTYNSTNPQTSQKLNSVLELIETFRKAPINEQVLEKVLKLQALAQEITDNGNND